MRRRRPGPSGPECRAVRAVRCSRASAGIDDEVVADRLQPQHGAQQEQRGSCRPGLRAARGRILDRVLGHATLVAAERLRESALEELRGVEDPGRDLGRLLLEAVVSKAPGDERAVERPDGPDVVADRVVAPLALGQRPDAPAGEEPRPEQVTGDCLRLRLVDDAAPEQVAVVRRQRVDLVAFRVERQREVLAVRDPEVAVEAPLEVGRLPLQLVGVSRVLPDAPRQPGAAHLRVVGVALQLAGRAREARQPAVAVRDRVPRVLPALVLETGLLVATPVPDVPVAHQVRVFVDPVEGGARLLLQVSHEPTVSGPALVLVEQHDVERGRVGRAEVGRVRALLERRQLPVAHLVEDPAGVLVPEVVDAASLPVAESLQRRSRRARA